jgi:tripartite-type tricarboxylate transporter receptor subunit TctC
MSIEGGREKHMHRRGLLRLAAALPIALAALHSAHLPSPSSAASPGGSSSRLLPGGSGDALARLIAEHLRVALDQPVIVENRVGAQGRIGVQAVKAAAADGKTLLLIPVGADVGLPARLQVARLRSDRRFPAGRPSRHLRFRPGGGPAGAAKTLKELVDWVKANPAQGSYGTPAAGTLPHFFAVSFAKAAGLRSAPRRLPRLGRRAHRSRRRAGPDRGHHHQRSARAAQGPTHPRARHLRHAALAVPAGRADLQEAGYDIQGRGWYGVFVPAKTPADVVERLNKAIVAAVQTPAVKERLLAFGLLPTGTSRPSSAASRRPIPSSGPRPSRPRLHAGAMSQR